jgi:sarcosine oxidase gamma subunit
MRALPKKQNHAPAIEVLQILQKFRFLQKRAKSAKEPALQATQDHIEGAIPATLSLL